jgi:hypothetical protein
MSHVKQPPDMMGPVRAPPPPPSVVVACSLCGRELAFGGRGLSDIEARGHEIACAHQHIKRLEARLAATEAALVASGLMEENRP